MFGEYFTFPITNKQQNLTVQQCVGASFVQHNPVHTQTHNILLCL